MAADDDPIRIDSDNVIAREVEGEVVILDTRSQRYIGGNRSASLLWSRLEAGTTRDELAEALAGEFGIDESRARADVDAFVIRLDQLGLLA